LSFKIQLMTEKGLLLQRKSLQELTHFTSLALRNSFIGGAKKEFKGSFFDNSGLFYASIL